MTRSPNLSTRLRAVARQYSSKAAVMSGDRVLTYGELDRAAMDLARWFLAQGLVQGDRVAIQGTNKGPTGKVQRRVLKDLAQKG